MGPRTSAPPPPGGRAFCPVAPFAGATSAGCWPSITPFMYSARSRYSLNCEPARAPMLGPRLPRARYTGEALDRD